MSTTRTNRMPRSRRARALASLAAAFALLAATLGVSVGADVGRAWGVDASRPAAAAPPTGETAGARWAWPVPSPRVIEPFRAPAHDYGPGHRGIDVRSGGGDAPAEVRVTAPDAGVVAFAGRVVDRDIVTIDHGDGIVSTLEPVTASVSAGEVVARGDAVGVLSLGGHTAPGMLHIGARVDGAYVDPMRFLGAFSWAVLLPCCE